MLAARTVFPPEVDISTVQLASRIVWPAETDQIATETHRFMVQRPPGEVGRPHDGGFALKTVLGWSCKKYTAVRVRLPIFRFAPLTNISIQKFVREQARLYLNTHLPLTRQDHVAVQKVYAAVG